jgi:hypothetical protein
MLYKKNHQTFEPASAALIQEPVWLIDWFLFHESCVYEQQGASSMVD